MRSAATAIAVSALLCGSPVRAAPPARLPRLLVLDFAVQGQAAPELARAAADAAVRQASRLGTFQVLAQADIVALLSVEHQRQILGCPGDRSCMAEIAGAIDAERTLSGTITRLGDSVLVSAFLVDARKVATLAGADETVRATTPREVLDAVRRVTHRVLTGRPLDTDGVLELRVEEDRARVILDGEEIGHGPMREERRVPEGSHRVAVAKDGYATWEGLVRVEAGGRASVAPRLVPHQAPPRWLLELRAGGSLPVGGGPWAPPELAPEKRPTALSLNARLAWRQGPAWSAEASGWWLAPTGGAGDVKMEMQVFLVGVAGVWSPSGNRYLSAALEAGGGHMTDRLSSPTSPRGSATGQEALLYGGADLRLDLPVGHGALGVRAGLLALSNSGSVILDVPPGPYRIRSSPIALLVLTLAGRIPL